MRNVLFALPILLMSLAFGFVVSLFSEISFLTACFMALGVLLLLGLWITDDGRLLGGLEHNPDETEESKRDFHVSRRTHLALIVAAFATSLATHVYF